jgi:hypothetical protein
MALTSTLSLVLLTTLAWQLLMTSVLLTYSHSLLLSKANLVITRMVATPVTLPMLDLPKIRLDRSTSFPLVAKTNVFSNGNTTLIRK